MSFNINFIFSIPIFLKVFYKAKCAYLIVESVSFVVSGDVSPINPKKTIEIINSRNVSV